MVRSIVSRPCPSDDSMISDLWTVKSAVHFIKKNYEKAIFSTTEALDLESSFPSILKNKNNVLIRRADSFSRINEFESAKLDLDLVDEPNEGQLKKMRIISKRIRELTKKNDDILAKGLSKMFWPCDDLELQWRKTWNSDMNNGEIFEMDRIDSVQNKTTVSVCNVLLQYAHFKCISWTYGRCNSRTVACSHRKAIR